MTDLDPFAPAPLAPAKETTHPLAHVLGTRCETLLQTLAGDDRASINFPRRAGVALMALVVRHIEDFGLPPEFLAAAKRYEREGRQ